MLKIKSESKNPSKIKKTKKIKIDEIKMFTDGSCSKNGFKIICGYGVIFGNKDIKNISKPILRSLLHFNYIIIS
jgi:hypothetical protein